MKIFDGNSGKNIKACDVPGWSLLCFVGVQDGFLPKKEKRNEFKDSTKLPTGKK